MINSEKKINNFKWLKAIGVEYYCHEQTKGPQMYSENITPKADDRYKLANELPEATANSYVNDKTESPIALARFLADKANNIGELKESLLNFNGCGLKKFATNTVFADGNPFGKVMLIGEAPGSNEDLQGIPFCGESGKLLDDMLRAIGISREKNAYITNTVFWRPPANRQPTQDEVDICRPFVEKHIALINPRLIILVGNTAATSLLGKNAGITRIRQEYYFYNNRYLQESIQVTAIFHPAYLLRQPMQKKASWYDLLKIQEWLEKKNNKSH